MKNHVWRPVIVVLLAVAGILVARAIVVPGDFGIGERGFMYGWHRASNQEEWKNMPNVKYKGKQYCSQCHPDKVELINTTPHQIIPCEDCHGPAIDHPQNPEKLAIDKRRDLCLRCHAALPYPRSGRAVIPGINNYEHNPGMECVMCHNPHNPGAGL
jgi:predicted CXXCH cytochrome family protein